MKKTFVVLVVVTLLFTLVSPMAFASEAPSMMESELEVEAGLTMDSSLYFLDEWMEDVQLSLATDEAKEMELLSEFAQERIAEVTVLSEKSGQEENITSTISNYEGLVDLLEEQTEGMVSEEVVVEEEQIEEDTAISEEEEVLEGEEELVDEAISEDEELEEENEQTPLTKARNAILVLTRVQEKLEQKNNMNASAAIGRNIARLEAKLLAEADPVEEDVIEDEVEVEEEQDQGIEEVKAQVEVQQIQAASLLASETDTNKVSKEEKNIVKAAKKEVQAQKKEAQVQKKEEKAGAAKTNGNSKEQRNNNKKNN